MMTSQELSHFRIVKNLKNELKTYGLNPREWSIDRKRLSELKSSRQFALLNRQDPEFRLSGEWTRRSDGRLSVNHLAVIGF